MARLDQQRRELAMRLRLNRASDNELTANQARLFVRSLQISWQVPPIRWSDGESREQLTDARRLLHSAAVFQEVDGPNSADGVSCYRRAAELLEWLARAGDPVTLEVPVALLAAGAYQLAGLPAMAASLLRGPPPSGATGRMFTAFLRADFEVVLDEITAFWQAHPALTGREGSAPLLAEIEVEPDPALSTAEEAEPADHSAADEPRTDKIGRYLVAESVRSIGLFADAVRKGNRSRVEQSLAKLRSLTTLATRLTSDELWLLFTLVEATARGFAANSIHDRVARLADRSPEGRPRMWRFAREQFARGRGILWTSQIQGLDRLIESDSFALCTPTGSGKTLVANLALVKELLLTRTAGGAPLALYLVPSRALAGEVERKLTAELGTDVIVTGLYGGADWGITDYWLTADRPVVLIATVEKAEALMRYVGHLLIRRLRLLVIDEAHQVVSAGNERARRELAEHISRPMRLEAMVSRLLVLKPDMARIALTAVAGGAAMPVARWIENDANAQPIGLGYRSSRQVIGALLCDPRTPPQATLEIVNGQTLYVRGRDAAIYLPLRIPVLPQPPALIRNSLPHHTELYTLWTALHLLAGGRRILISVLQSPERLMRRCAEAFGLNGCDAVPRFAPPVDAGDRALFGEARAACVDYCGPKSFEVRLLDCGIATNHGQMPQRLRRLMTDLIERRICPLTIATATLTEGVNLPFDIIFLTSLVRRGFDAAADASEVEPVPTSEFRNLAGRAGRPGAAEAIEGMTFVALPVAPSTTAQGQRDTQYRQIGAADAQFIDLLRRLQAEEVAGGLVQSPLATLLRAIVAGCRDILGLTDAPALLAWLDATLPEHVGANLATGSRDPRDQLGDSLDELDGFVLAATEELSLLDYGPIDGPRAEAFLRDLWRRTFTHVAASQEAVLETLFIRRGRAFVERLYPNAGQRRRLYRFGFTPFVGRRFELLAPIILDELQTAFGYGADEAEARFQLFRRLAERLRSETGIGFKVRVTAGDQAVLGNWEAVMGWWMQRPGAVSPEPERLRAWQRFVADNLDFRLGVAVGAAVAQLWGQNAGGLEKPTLQTWRETTGLPWIGFWFRELLRWGTLDPFVAFALAQGLATTRKEAQALRPRFDSWLATTSIPVTPEALIDPQQYLAWQRAGDTVDYSKVSALRSSVAELTGVDGRRASYDVRPIVGEGGIDWLDPAGYAVARSPLSIELLTQRPGRHDFSVDQTFGTRVSRTF
ncbi:DEAD/DEAH box helicase [Methylobacterium mesophilicum]